MGSQPHKSARYTAARRQYSARQARSSYSGRAQQSPDCPAAAWREARIVEDFVLHGARQFLAGIIARRECRAHNFIEFHGWLEVDLLDLKEPILRSSLTRADRVCALTGPYRKIPPTR